MQGFLVAAVVAHLMIEAVMVLMPASVAVAVGALAESLAPFDTYLVVAVTVLLSLSI
jgi:hypothetical protein